MIRPPPDSRPLDPAAVERHYGTLDRFYRELWGDHLHHGLWERGDEPTHRAVEALVHRVAASAGIAAGSRVCDVGCGYGATARLLAGAYGARVTGVTLSRRQFEVARQGLDAVEPSAPPPRFVLGDWLGVELPEASFDAVIAVESLTHMPDLEGALRRIERILVPGGRFSACVWLSATGPGVLSRRWLLEPICREGRLAGLPTADELAAALRRAGLVPEAQTDLHTRVRRTWTVVVERAVRRLVSDPGARRFLMDPGQPDRIFALTVLRLWIALHTGRMRYGLFTARKA